MAGRGGWLGDLPRPLGQGLGALPQTGGNLEQHMPVRGGRKCRLILKVSCDRYYYLWKDTAQLFYKSSEDVFGVFNFSIFL